MTPLPAASQDRDAMARVSEQHRRREPVGFDDDRNGIGGLGEFVFDVAQRIVGVAECSVVGGRNVRGVQQVLAENFTALQFGRGGGRAEHTQPRFFHRVDQADDQRGFGTDDGQVNGLLARELDDSFDVGHGKIDINRLVSRSGIPWSHKDLCDFWALFQFPSEGMFATAAANHQYVHSFREG